MKNRYIRLGLATALPLLAMNLNAAQVDLAAARMQALNELNMPRPGRLAPAVVNVDLAHAERSSVDETLADYYVFNASDGSAFVIVAGDDRACRVLACGDGSLDMEALPCGLQWLLDYYKEQMEYLVANPAAVVTPLLDSRSTTITPMLYCTWSQGTPYNDMCPIYRNARCVTGCIATAMAQVMYYWKYPDVLPELQGYITNGGTVEVSPLPGTTLDWDNMLDGYMQYYSQEQGDAVATLMRYCGQATSMVYGRDASGSGVWNQMTGLTTFDYYLGSRIVHRDDYSTEDWRTMMLNELQADRPILYSGSGEGGGHAFVVDGFDGTKFHINWGWEGAGNGYFVIDAFTIYDYDFNGNQRMIVDLYPADYKLPYDVEQDGICYRKDGNTLTVTSRSERVGTYQGQITIPAHVNVDGVDCEVTAIGNSAFKSCTHLTSVELPSTLKRIGKFAFKECIALTTVNLPASLEDIGYAAFQDCRSIKSLSLGSGLKHIGSYAFYGCRGLKQVLLSNRVTDLDVHAFYFCPQLKTLAVDMESIIDEAFTCCYSLQSLTLGSHVRTIGSGSFADCQLLKEVTMGANVDSIAPMAFNGCLALEAIRKLPEAPPVVADENSFSEETYSKATLYVPESTWEDYYCCDVWTLFEHQVIDKGGLTGDVNGDGSVNIADINLVINQILTTNEQQLTTND